MIEAQVICDSISEHNKRLTTLQLRYPKFIHGEFMTHRVFSRNASSSRAVPTAKLLEEVRSDELRAKPEFWGMNKPGMQDGGEATDWQKRMAERNWAIAANNAADNAEYMANLGLHKQIVNRVIEPFTHINVVVTATEFDNFFGLRLDKGADPTMQALAKAMWAARNASTPKLLFPNQWHLPYCDPSQTPSETKDDDHEWLVKISVARCARVSYMSFDTSKRSTIEEDLKLYDRLMGSQPLHASPAEHQATPDSKTTWRIINHSTNELADFVPGVYEREHQHGNFIGWRQYRKMLAGEAVAPLPTEYCL